MQLDIKAEAEDDLARIYEFNLQRGEQWADRVEARLLDRVEALPSTPRIGRLITDEGVRRLSIVDIQYAIDYEIIGDVLRILRFLSTREIP